MASEHAKVLGIDFDPLAEALLFNCQQAFIEICGDSLRLIESFERRGRVGQADFTCLSTFQKSEQGSLLFGISVTEQTYLKLIKRALPKEVATGINDDTRDLLMSLMRRTHHLSVTDLKIHHIPLNSIPHTLIEGPQHSLYVPSVVVSKIVVMECEAGSVYLEFAQFPKTGLERVL